MFGQGAIGFQDIGAPVGVETDRDSLAGTDILINRRHFVLHPRGIKWAGDTGIAPNNAGLATAANWERVYDPKQIRIVAFKHKINNKKAGNTALSFGDPHMGLSSFNRARKDNK